MILDVEVNVHIMTVNILNKLQAMSVLFAKVMNTLKCPQNNVLTVAQLV